jgi:predicted ATPase
LLSSELLLVKGSLLVEHSAAVAESWFAKAVERADQLDAPMLQLRATLALARLWLSQAKPAPAAASLRTAYERFTEGFATADLIDARRMLDELADG